jgi:hypothetical protein
VEKRVGAQFVVCMAMKKKDVAGNKYWLSAAVNQLMLK